MGRWSEAVAGLFIDWLGAPHGWRWLDVGCGTGALTALISRRLRPTRVAGVDTSPGFVEAARRRLPANVDLRLADAMDLPFAADEFDAAVSGIALNFVPVPRRAVSEMNRVVGTGGVVAAYVWDYADGMEMIRRFWDAAVALDPEAAALDEANRFPMCRPEQLETMWSDAGLSRVETASLEGTTTFADFDDLWNPILAGTGPAPGYVAGLNPTRRGELAHRLAARLPVAADGTIRMRARAWAVRGNVGAQRSSQQI